MQSPCQSLMSTENRQGRSTIAQLCPILIWQLFERNRQRRDKMGGWLQSLPMRRAMSEANDSPRPSGASCLRRRTLGRKYHVTLLHSSVKGTGTPYTPIYGAALIPCTIARI